MGFTNNYNLMTQFAAFPCAQPDPIIIALTFIPAVAPAILEYASLTCRDIIKARLGHQAPCGRALKGPLAKVTPPSWLAAGEKLMKFEGGFSKIGNWFMIADLASDTLARWTTEAYRLSGCPDAFEGAAWQYSSSVPGAYIPGIPHPIGGSLINETGRPGIAWPTGAIVPPGWYVSIEFNVECVTLPGAKPCGSTIWIMKTGDGTYDFPANRIGDGYRVSLKNNGYHLYTGGNDETRSHQYTMMIQTDTTALCRIVSGTGQATPFAQDNWGLEPLSCFTSLLHERIQNPAGRNHASKWPTVAGVKLKPPGDPIPRGRPGGKPRSKK